MRASVPDEELVEAAIRGDASAFGALLERHRARLYATALSILREREAALDAVQDACLIALRKIGDLHEPSAAGPWLRSIVRTASWMRLRAAREAPSEMARIEWLKDVERGADAHLEDLALRDWVWASLEALPSDLRATVMLRYFSGTSSYADIASILCVPVGTVRSRLNEAKRRLGASLLATAERQHRDQKALLDVRWRRWSAAVDEMNDSALPHSYLSDLAGDVVVHKAGTVARGAAAEWCSIRAGLDAGVRLRLTGMVVSEDVTIVEATHENPDESPDHCPPTLTEVRFHPGGRTTKWFVHFGNATDHAAPDRTNGSRPPDPSRARAGRSQG